MAENSDNGHYRQWLGRDILSVTTDPARGPSEFFSRAEYENTIFPIAEAMKKAGTLDILKGKRLLTFFQEVSSRTRLSFDSAMKSLGGEVIDVGDIGRTSMTKKDESLTDTFLTIGGYGDALVVRHAAKGVPKWAARLLDIPVINAGDGSRQHPTQTMLDLFTMDSVLKRDGKKGLDGMSIALAGDLKHGRTIGSLGRALTQFEGIYFYMVSPPQLKLAQQDLNDFRKNNAQVEILNGPEELAGKGIDFLYVTRIQKERFDPEEFAKVAGSYRITSGLAEKIGAYIMHPLPIDKTSPEIDPHVTFDYKKAIYHTIQDKNGVPVRMALLSLIFLGEKATRKAVGLK